MSRNRVQSQQSSRVEGSLDRILVANSLAELVPRTRRGRAPLALKLAFLLVAVTGLVGFPAGAVALCLVLAGAIEAMSYQRQRYGSLVQALTRPSFWERLRPPFYWTLVTAAGLVALVHAREPLLLSLLRAGILWLGCRGIQDVVQHPERYRSWDTFVDWLSRVERQADRAWSTWLSFVILTVAASFAINLAVPGIWQSVGNAGWDRLFLFGSVIGLLSLFALARSARSTVRSMVQESLGHWGEPQAGDLDRALRTSQTTPDAEYVSAEFAAQIKERLQWKDVDNLAVRVGTTLEHALTRRIQLGALLGGASAFLATLSFLAISVFLIVPEDVIADWVSPGQAGEREVILAFGDFDELLSLQFAERLLSLDRSSLLQEPIPKVAFLEAVMLVSLMFLRAAIDPSALKLMANADRANMQRWLLLGTAYLVLLEREFQYLHRGFVARQVTGERAFRLVPLPNVVLVGPSATTKAGVYRAISQFYDLYTPVNGEAGQLVAVFPSHRSAKAWTTTFVRSPAPPLERPGVRNGKAIPEPATRSERFWIWSDDQLVDLTSLEEAQLFGRFVAR
jgi:hypothetical protein